MYHRSFQRQLSLYGFGRITSGKKRALRFHDSFVRGDSSSGYRAAEDSWNLQRLAGLVAADRARDHEGRPTLVDARGLEAPEARRVAPEGRDRN